jgi:hypothetical protein
MFSSASDLIRFRDGSDKRAATNFVQISKVVLRIPRNVYTSVRSKKVPAVHGNSKFTETEKGEAVEEENQEGAHHFHGHKGDYSQRIRPGKPNST